MLIALAADGGPPAPFSARDLPLPRNGALERLVAQRFGPKAQQIVRLLHETPGLNIDELAAAMGVRRTATNHHVRLLERSGVVVRMRQARNQLHFAGDITPFERSMFAALRVPSVQDVARLLFEGHPPASAALSQALGVTGRTVRRALRLLSTRGLLRIQDETGRKVAHLHPFLRVLLARRPDRPEGLAPTPPS